MAVDPRRQVTVVIDGDVAIMRLGAWRGEGEGQDRMSLTPRDHNGRRISPDEALARVVAGAVFGLNEDGTSIIIGDPGQVMEAGSEPLPKITEFRAEVPPKEERRMADQAAAPVAEKTTAAPKAKKEAHDCACGCGMQVMGNFGPGHDSKLRSLINKVHDGAAKESEIPKIAYERLGRDEKDGYPIVHGRRFGPDPKIAEKAAAAKIRGESKAKAEAERVTKQETIAKDKAERDARVEEAKVPK